MDLTTLRSLFPITQKYIFVNHSGTAPTSTRVTDAMTACMKEIAESATLGVANWERVLRKFKQDFARFIGAKGEGEIAFTLNTAEGINIVAQGLSWRPGDNVVIPDTEYPANVYPWMNLKDRGVEVRLVPEVGADYPPEQIESYVDERTRLVAVSFVQFASGCRLDLKTIGEMCRRRGILFLVDAIQGLGVFPLNVEQMHIDFLSTSTYKWMLGPQGAGLFYIRGDLLDQVKPVFVGAGSVRNAEDYLTYDFTPASGARRYESGTIPTICLAGAQAALGLIEELGLDFIAVSVLKLTEILRQEAMAKGWQIYSPWEPEKRSGILSIFKPGLDSNEARRILLKNQIISVVRGGRLRLAPHCYNTPQEMERVIELLP